MDVLKDLSPQEREDITSSAQHALRLINFDQIDKILALVRPSIPESIPLEGQANGLERKRPSESNGLEEDSPEAKKERREDEVVVSSEV